MQELSGGSPTASLLYGPGIDELLLRAGAAGARWLVADGLGSALALIDPAGAVQTQYAYEAFGATSATGEGSDNASQFTGRENDGTGLYYYRARYYSPRLQRFVSEDPIGFEGGDTNLYAYVFNDPINLTDPSGESPLLLCALGAGIELFTTPMDGRKTSPFETAAKGCASSLLGWGVGKALGYFGRPLLSSSQFSSPLSAAAAVVPTKPLPQVLQNQAKGNAARDGLADLLRGSGVQLETEVMKKTIFGNRRIDIEVWDCGRAIGGIEVKSGGSRYNPSQRAKDTWLWLRYGYRVDVVRMP